MPGGSALDLEGLAGDIAQALERAFGSRFDRAKAAKAIDAFADAIAEYVDTHGGGGGGGGGGEANTASNLGGGAQVFASKSGVDLRFRSFVAGTGLTVSQGSSTITVGASIGTGGSNVAAGNDSRFTDARAPLAHAASHISGSDQIQDATAAQKGLATAAQISKLDGIEANADVTDAANVASAGAVMGSSYSAKALIIAGTGVGTYAAVPAPGSDGLSLVSDVAESTGMKWAAASGSGDVVGPAGVTADTIALFDGTTGKLIKAAVLVVDGSGNVSGVNNISLTGTVDGRDVAADGSKLDGIENGATADQTASEILTLLLTVDGAGSLLDADLLDGFHAIDFASASHAHVATDITDSTTAGRALLTAVDASAQRTALNVDPAGTDNSVNVTLAGAPDYITISGQVITRNAVDLASDVIGDLPVTSLNGGTGASATTFWRGDGTWATPAGGSGSVPDSAYTGKGVVLVGTGSGTYVALVSTTNGHVLTVDTAEASGLKFAAPTGGGGSGNSYFPGGW